MIDVLIFGIKGFVGRNICDDQPMFTVKDNIFNMNRINKAGIII